MAIKLTRVTDSELRERVDELVTWAESRLRHDAEVRSAAEGTSDWGPDRLRAAAEALALTTVLRILSG